jgi:4-hydroxy-L-threonine phosphate dehydrogenase PdxA
MKIAITLGDPAGIGPEIILKSAPTIRKYGTQCIIYGSKAIFKKTAQDMKMVGQYRSIADRIRECVPDVRFEYGKPNRATGRAAMRSINAALKDGCDVLITPPIVKDVIRSSYPQFTGHTEYLARFFNAKKYAMVGMWRHMRILLLTTHVPLRRIFKYIKSYDIAEKIMLFDWGLKKFFKVTQPRIGVSALNPHAFEFSLGEDEHIRQGVMIAHKIGVQADGPFPADSLFNRVYDGYVTMYHDQAMIYLKSKRNGLNFTLGLPIIRLSPLYGAALDIAGKKKAQASGLTEALKKGITLFTSGEKYERIQKQ